MSLQRFNSTSGLNLISTYHQPYAQNNFREGQVEGKNKYFRSFTVLLGRPSNSQTTLPAEKLQPSRIRGRSTLSKLHNLALSGNYRRRLYTDDLWALFVHVHCVWCPSLLSVVNTHREILNSPSVPGLFSIGIPTRRSQPMTPFVVPVFQGFV